MKAFVRCSLSGKNWGLWRIHTASDETRRKQKQMYALALALSLIHTQMKFKRMYILGISWREFWFTNASSITHILQLTNASSLGWYLQGKQALQDRIVCLTYLCIAWQENRDRSADFEWHYTVNSSEMQLLILPVPLILSMQILNNKQ